MQAKVPDWNLIRDRARVMPESAFQFVREGLALTVRHLHGPDADADGDGPGRHVTGQQLSIGLCDLARQRYGLLAPTVLAQWGVRRTNDFGLIVYALIDRGELRCNDDDRLDDFDDVCDFAQVFSPESILGLKLGPRPALRGRTSRPSN